MAWGAITSETEVQDYRTVTTSSSQKNKIHTGEKTGKSALREAPHGDFNRI